MPDKKLATAGTVLPLHYPPSDPLGGEPGADEAATPFLLLGVAGCEITFAYRLGATHTTSKVAEKEG